MDMQVRCGITSGVVDASLNLFVDDICRKAMVKDGLASTAHERLWHSSQSLGQHLANGGYRQNMSKNEIVLSLRSGAANRSLA